MLHSTASTGMSILSRGGRHSSSEGTCLERIRLGRITSNCMINLPLSFGRLKFGIPPPSRYLITLFCITSPGRLRMQSLRLSNVVTVLTNPQSDSTRSNGTVINKSSPCRLNTGCSIASRIT